MAPTARTATAVVLILLVFLALSTAGAVSGTRWAAPITLCGQNSYWVKTVPDGSGGFYAVWHDIRTGFLNLYATRIDRNGDRCSGWNADGNVVTDAANAQQYPELCYDAATGGIIVAWEEAAMDIYAQRLGPDGTRAWQNPDVPPGDYNGVPLCKASSIQRFPRVVTDGAGGAIVSWEDYRSGSNYDIYAQRIQSNGTVAWTADGVAVCDAASSQDESRIIADGAGGAIITWQDFRSNDNLDIYASRLNSSGARPVGWAEDGNAICTDQSASQGLPNLVSDNAQGAMVVWQSEMGPWSLWATRILQSGVIEGHWPADGLEIVDTMGGQMDDAAEVLGGTGAGGASITLAFRRGSIGSYDVRAQRINADATFPTGWGASGGVVITDASNNQEFPRLATDGADGAFVAWQDSRSGMAVYATRIGPDAAFPAGWAKDGIPVSTGADNQGGPDIVTDAAAGAYVAWADYTLWDVMAQRISNPAPTVASITPQSGTQGTTVNVTDLAGTGFQAGAAVELQKAGQADLAATGVNMLSSTQIACSFNIPAGAATGSWDVHVENADGQGATLDDGFTVNAAPPEVTYPTWYLAEGTTAWGFSTYISVVNPNPSQVTVDLTYMPSGEVNRVQTVLMPARSRATVFPADLLGAKDFSTKVSCREGKTISADRTMMWTGAGSSTPGTHSSIGVNAPAATWYLPEGSSKWGFECWLLIQNPNAAAATCNVTYMIEGEGPVTVPHTVGPNSRATFNMKNDIGEKDASIKVESNRGVIPERSMYRNGRREGHDSIGTTSPATDYYLAEGTTAWGFTTYVLVQNPSGSTSQVNVTYMTPEGPVAHPGNPITMPANSRKTIRVNDFLPNRDFSTRVTGSTGIIAERAMYWDNGTGEACHDSIGMASPHSRFYLPDGESGSGVETWTVVQNPGGAQVTVTLTYLSSDGSAPVTVTDSVPANSRESYSMASVGLSGRRGIMVSATGNVMVERAMYWSNRGAGANTIGGFE